MKTDNLDPRSRRTRALLREAMEHLASEKGFQSLTIKEVTEQAGLDRTTFYLHYSGLHALMEDCARVLFDQMRQEIYANKPVNIHSDPAAFEPFVASVFHHLEQHEKFYKSMLGRHGDPFFRALFQELLSELIFEPITYGYADNESVRSGMTLRFYSAGFAGLASWWLEKDMPISVDQASAQVATAILPGYLQLLETNR
jgi:AcrR family transcriptional regulator